MAEVKFIEGVSELGIEITKTETEIMTEELLLMEQNMITTGKIFKAKLADLITSLETRGMTTEQVANVLLDDLQNDGQIFGGLKRGLIGASDDLVNVTSQRLSSEQFREQSPNELMTWIAVLVATCIDCLPRHGVTRKYSEWVARGLPASGFSVCKGRCDCQLFPANIAESKAELQEPLRRVKGKITQIAKEKKKDGEIKNVKNYVNRKLGRIHNTKEPLRKDFRKLLPGFKR